MNGGQMDFVSWDNFQYWHIDFRDILYAERNI